MLIIFAWAMEIVGVTGGAINSTYTTFGDELPTSLAGYVPAVPMVALAAAELGRVPLASVIYDKHKIMQIVAVLGIVALGYIAVENWTFGFERVVDLRLKPVNAAGRELLRAEAELSRLIEQRNRLEESSGRKRDELRAGIAKRDAGTTQLTAQLSQEAEAHRANLEGIREACRIIRDRCMVPRSQSEDSRYALTVSRVSAELEGQRNERKRLQGLIDELVSIDAAQTAEIDREIAAADGVVTEARKSMRAVADGNQIYRLAANWYGVSTADVTPEQFAMARWVFSTFSAIAVALAGSIAALVYYARSRPPGHVSFIERLAEKVAHSRRRYYARLRRPLKVKVPVKVVVRWVDRIVLIPRWGIRIPVYVNSLIRRPEGALNGHQRDCDAQESCSNVMQLKKAH